MRRIVSLVFIAAMCCSTTVLACGDKFLLIGRGASYRGRYVAIHPASILLSGPRAAGSGEIDVRRILQRAGHHVDYAADDAQLQAAIRSRKYDIIVTPMDTLAAMESQVRSLSSNALVLPILFASNEKEVAQAEKQYECIAKSTAKQRSFLGVLDDAMDIRLKGQLMSCPWNKGS